MDLSELRKMTVPKLRERAKQITDLQGVIGMKKEELIEAIAKAEGISYKVEAQQKDVTKIRSIKREIRDLRNRKGEIRASSKDHAQLERIRKKIKRLKRLTRKLAVERSRKKALQPVAEPEAPPAPPG